MKGIRFANVIATSPFTCCFFLQYFSPNVPHLSDSIYNWNCCNQAPFLNKKVIMKRLVIKIIAWNFLQLPIEKM